jgi:hypothetical protein
MKAGFIWKQNIKNRGEFKMNEENEIELHTSNWLYNAGVIG